MLNRERSSAMVGCHRPIYEPHITHAMEVCAIFDRNARCTNVADEHSRLKDLNFCSSCNRSVDFAAGHERAGGKNAFENRLLSDNESPGSVNFPFNAAVDADGLVKVENTLEIDSLPEEGKIIAVAGVLSAFVA